MPEVVFTMKGVSKVVGGQKYILKDIYLSYFYGAKIGVVGNNGSGKSTLLRILAGVDQDFIGEVFYTRKLKIGYLPQEPELNGQKTVKETILEGAGPLNELFQEWNWVNDQLSQSDLDSDKLEDLIQRQAQLQEQIESLGGWEIEEKIQYLMDSLRCPDANSWVAHLSGGERRRVALARLLLSQPDVLLLDEPTNHLDAESVNWLEQYLKEFKGTVIAVTHDRYFLDHVAEWILELDRGEGYPFKGNYTQWLEQKVQKALNSEVSLSKGRLKVLMRELDWIKQNPAERSQKSLSRLSRYETLLKQASESAQVDEGRLVIPPGPRLGDQVLEFRNVTKAMGSKLLMEKVSFSIPKGSIVGVIGPNGVGKTTLFRLIVSEIQPDEGDIILGPTVKVTYVAQLRELEKDGQMTVLDFVSQSEPVIRLGSREIPSRQYLAWFGFSGEAQQKRMANLSGGERNRAYLARAVLMEGNLLLLDEPTNDLDVATMQLLEDALLDFAGCVIVISHDRYFLDRICTHLLVFEGDSQVTFFTGNFTDYARYVKQTTGREIWAPKKIRFRMKDMGLST